MKRVIMLVLVFGAMMFGKQEGKADASYIRYCWQQTGANEWGLYVTYGGGIYDPVHDNDGHIKQWSINGTNDPAVQC